ncbi:hypothetical protein, conserved [Plasmodium gonderi]|uniref:TRUD domain-containing protein n=1 Tax=Plasmodium gonderi TaxID=77519 RepID=A0A1Y1JCT9_PLAGO|nr:hypothetical protein, conserved [Plasmodium gonderi]GAW80050.1 hypothetical protein, conserved [Plasmodium gonderi]
MIEAKIEPTIYGRNHGIDYLFRKDLHNNDGIEGKIKTIYEDFHVHEITKDNEILRLEQLIHKKKINEIIEQNEKNEKDKLLLSITNKELHLHVLAKYVNEYNIRTFKQFMSILYDIYQLKENDQTDEMQIGKTVERLKNVSVPYCLFINLDDLPIQDKSHFDENGDAICNEESMGSDSHCGESAFSEPNSPEDPKDRNKNARKNIHKIIHQYYPFLLTETINVPKNQSVLSHGNILQNNSSNNYNCENIVEENKTDDKISVLQIYPSFNCLKSILPRGIFNKLKGKTKKSRFSENDLLENIICQKLDKIDKKKEITMFPKRLKLSDGEEVVAPDIFDAKEDDLFENKKRKFESETLSKICCEKSLKMFNIHGENKRARTEVREISNDKNIYEVHSYININSKLEEEKNPKETIQRTCNEKNASSSICVAKTDGRNNNDQEGIGCHKGGLNELPNKVQIHSRVEGIFLDKLNNFRKNKKEQKKEKKYLHFNLYKENKDIYEILSKIKFNLKKKNADISYCGIKDKRGITVQKFCIHKIKKYDLFRIIKNDSDTGGSSWCNNVYISNLCYEKNKLSLGDLKGNFFKILIRGVDNSAEKKFQVLSDSFSKLGFVNYYGYQRFGSKNIKNYDIGICILKKNYKEALFYVIENSGLDRNKKDRLIAYLNEIDEKKDAINGNEDDENHLLNSFDDETGTQNKGIDKKNDQQLSEKIYTSNKNGNQVESNNNIPLHLPYEAVNTFSKKNNKKKKKFMHCSNKKVVHNVLPSEINEIINSISNQSHVEKTILCSLKNDKSFKNAFMNIPKNIFSLFIHSTQSLIFNILTSIRMKKYGLNVVVGDLIESNCNNEITLTNESSNDEHQSDLSSGNENLWEKNIIKVTNENISLYNIYDVVLPLPGDKNFIFPPNLMDEYKNVLNSMQLTLDDFKSEKNFFNASGGYRKIVVKPYDFKSFFIKSDDVYVNRIPLIRSDLCRLMDGEKGATECDPQNGEEKIGDEKVDDKKMDGEKINETEEMKEHIIFVPNDDYHEYLIKEIPKYQTKASIFLICSLPKSSYITVALMEVLKS